MPNLALPTRPQERALRAHSNWLALSGELRLKLERPFVANIRAKLHDKRLYEGKDRLLERLKARVWHLFEEGTSLTTPYTSLTTPYTSRVYSPR